MIAIISFCRNGGMFVIFFILWGDDSMLQQETERFNIPRVVFCQRERLQKGSRYGPIIRRFFVVECNEVGHGSVIINGKEFRFGPGQCYVLLPGDTVTHTCDGKAPRGGIFAVLEAPMLAQRFKEAGITSETPFLPERLFPRIRQWLERMLEDYQSRDAGADMRQASHIYGLVGSLLREKTAVAKTDTVTRATGIMEANYHAPFSVDSLAKTLGLERSYFSHLFKERTGYSPHRYLTALRIQKACLLLRETGLPVAEIAENVGLDPRNFARQFHRETGVTPLEYKKQKQQTVPKVLDY